MNVIALVLFLLFCPILVVFLLRLGKTFDDESCPFCNHQKKEDDSECGECGFQFMSNPKHGKIWLWGMGALGCVASFVLWIESQAYL